jgi:hypothetical protein
MKRGATSRSKYLQNCAVLQAQIQNETLPINVSALPAKLCHDEEIKRVVLTFGGQSRTVKWHGGDRAVFATIKKAGRRDNDRWHAGTRIRG